MALSDEQFMEMGKQYAHEPDENGICTLCGMDHDDVLPGPCIGALLAVVRDMKVELAFPLEQLRTREEALKRAAKMRIATTGESGKFLEIEGASIKATHPKKPRVTWDSAGLEGYAVANPDVLKFRKEKWSAPSISPVVE